jgi:hypothetical protein
MKKILLLALVAISGLSFGQTAAIAILDAGTPSHNAGDSSTITAVPAGFVCTAAELTYTWGISGGTHTFDLTAMNTAGAGPHNGAFSQAVTYTVTVALVGNACGAVGESESGSGTQDVTISEAGTPVVVANQSVVLSQSTAKLSWSTFSEFNNDFFSVTRSSNGVDFEEIGTVQGKGNTKLTQYYMFEDKNPLAGVSYYQIVQHDFDGSFVSLSALPIKNLKNSLNVIKLSPNPVNESSVIDFEATHQGSVELKVFDLMGRSVISQLVSVEKGLNSVNLDMSFLSNGLYQVSLSDGLNNVIEKIYKN